MESPRLSAQQQLDLLAADREVLRGRAAFPVWYWMCWSLAVNWWGLVAVIPNPQPWWLAIFPFALFAIVLGSYSLRRVKVPRAPLTKPTTREVLIVVPVLALQGALMYYGFSHDARWLVSLTAALSTVGLAVFAHRTQRVVFQDER